MGAVAMVCAVGVAYKILARLTPYTTSASRGGMDMIRPVVIKGTNREVRHSLSKGVKFPMGILVIKVNHYPSMGFARPWICFARM
jgi:hypothetical protein